MPIDLICLDADDTLWHNMRHFDAAERAFGALLAPLAEPGIARERLDAVGARNLALYGFGAKSFTLSMIETALELSGDNLLPAMVAAILRVGRDLLAHPVELLNGVEDTLDRLTERARLVLVTKGDLFHQEAKLAASGLGERFSAIEIVSDKTPETFRRLFARHDVAPDHGLVAGDSIRSDVIPALEAGAWAAYVPHEIVWSYERADAPDHHPRYRRLDRIADLVGWVDTLT